MDEPVYWTVLLVIAVAAAGARLALGRPLWPRRSSALRPWELVAAAVSLLALVFHCAAMFFAEWVDAVPSLEEPAASVRALGTVSQAAYWVPAVLLVVATRRVWPPVLALMGLALAGVGATMFWPFELSTHLGWIAAAVVAIAAVAAGFVARPAPSEPGARSSRGHRDGIPA